MRVEHRFSTDTVKDESRVWAQWIAPQLQLPRNVFGICQYGFTEMLNNVIDHSRGRSVRICCTQDDGQTVLEVEDDGVGVFASLRQHFGFDSDIHALINLVKGKLTVAPQAHSGEGLFFSARMFDQFVMTSGELEASFEAGAGQCQVRAVPAHEGTHIRMVIANDSPRTAQGVFAQFTDPDELTFCKTKFFVSLATFEGELISRSQAKRVVTGFERFSQVELDFGGVDQVGQGFADELVRVWPLAHPDTRLKILNAGEAVMKMLRHVVQRTDLPQPAQPVVIVDA